MKHYSGINLKCSHCDKKFDAAASLLLHFANHIHNSELLDNQSVNNAIYKTKLYTGTLNLISVQQQNYDGCMNILSKCEDIENTVQDYNDSNSKDFNEDFNPLKFCAITMDENGSPNLRKILPKKKEQYLTKMVDIGSLGQKKKYTCHLCQKVFGWSTDLKRHILIHTGERPYKCPQCNAAFTRNFLLQKHLLKIHSCRQVLGADSLQKQVDTNIAHLKSWIKVQ